MSDDESAKKAEDEPAEPDEHATRAGKFIQKYHSFLSTFVMIGQNRQAAFQQAKADHDFVEGDTELKLNTELTREIHELTREIHEHVLGDPGQDR